MSRRRTFEEREAEEQELAARLREEEAELDEATDRVICDIPFDVTERDRALIKAIIKNIKY